MGKKLLACGYTTGTCAQAATRAAVRTLMTGEQVEKVNVELPGGKALTLAVREVKMGGHGPKGRDDMPLWVSCAVKKDSGDDPDVTDGVLVYSKVMCTDGGQIIIEGGEGIGRVTKPGLSQPIGSAAINRVPRQMIRKEAKEACEDAGYFGGLLVEISIPGGKELASKTFNPRLGIEGGLSILGTSGIVEPMSEQALIDTICLELKVKLAEGRKRLVVTPGNYGLEFLRREYGIEEDEAVKCSNFIGQTLDLAAEKGCRGIFLAGHIGKLVKLAGGIMNTHSSQADCRMEILAAAALRAGLGGTRACRLLDCTTVDDALGQCTQEERLQIMEQVMGQAEKYLSYRVQGELQVEVLMFSNVYGILGKSSGADAFMDEYRSDETAVRLGR